MKCYIVTQSPIYVDDYDSQIAVFLNKEKAKNFVDEHNIPYNDLMNQAKLCEKCHTYDDEECFILQHTCSLASIKKDRNGLYCENEKSLYANGVDYYSYEEVELID